MTMTCWLKINKFNPIWGFLNRCPCASAVHCRHIRILTVGGTRLPWSPNQVDRCHTLIPSLGYIWPVINHQCATSDYSIYIRPALVSPLMRVNVPGCYHFSAHIISATNTIAKRQRQDVPVLSGLIVFISDCYDSAQMLPLDFSNN